MDRALASPYAAGNRRAVRLAAHLRGARTRGADVGEHAVDGIGCAPSVHLDRTPPLTEKRTLAALPTLTTATVTEYPARFSEWFRDHFGLRARLVRSYGRLYAALGVSSSPRVTLGKDDWLFFTDDVRTHEVRTPVAPARLDAWQAGLESLERHVAAHGARYLLVLAPIAPTVYPEHLPESVRPAVMPSRLDVFVERLRQRPQIPVVDLRPALLAARATAAVFPRTDTHWNALGALAAEYAIVDRLREWFPAMRPSDPADFTVAWREQPAGDLGSMLAVEDVRRESVPELTPRGGWKAEYVSWEPSDSVQPSAFALRVPGSTAPRALVIHTSFTFAHLHRLLAEHFSETRFVRRMDVAIVPAQPPAFDDGFEPDVVIHETVERMLLLDAQ
jgi:hypothetical protein